MDGIPGVILAAFVGYLLGSIPFGLLLTKAAGLGDIRGIGSGNIGATNVLRTGNKWLALATLLLDAGKGAAAVFIARSITPDAVLIAAAAAFFGHLHPMWLNFRGGKGVAVFLGIALAINLWLGLLCCGVWLLTGVMFRYSSVAALAAAAIAPVYAMALVGLLEGVLFILLALMIFLRHTSNIRRLLRGEEPKIGQK
ncbi:glycerol-3-phosphate 1-O-acyltransferase PlsY [Iodidimonas sp. SYSU 1G8]|uniref:glycerol-3-phosphate 1-O-acyltransferase PlsY n=1 Tax=Iodidimonas sp. SYSU 1G8 TaxID=3133967 RepID=UPI0031FF3B18